MRRFDIQSIVAPLLVMLMLTLLVGYTSYQMTQNWGQVTRNITTELVRNQILNNIHWQLRQCYDELMSGHDGLAKERWDTAREQVRFMQQTLKPDAAPAGLNLFMRDDANMAKIPMILKQDYFQYNVSKAQSDLEVLQDNARRITIVTTLSMGVLGILLISVTALDLSRLFRQLARSRELNNSIQEEERHRIAQELHDSVVQELIDLKRDYQPYKIDTLVESIRRICHSLKPQVLEDLGFKSGLELLAEDLRQHAQCQVTLRIDESRLATLPKEYELPLFRIVQELFNNIKRHAQATKVSLTMVYEPEESPLLRLYVRDNGVGFDTRLYMPGQRLKNNALRGQEQRLNGMGLAGVEDRVNQMAGKILITSSPRPRQSHEHTVNSAQEIQNSADNTVSTVQSTDQQRELDESVLPASGTQVQILIPLHQRRQSDAVVS